MSRNASECQPPSGRSVSKWIVCPRPTADARIRLFCLSFAGGGASAYRQWPAGLPSWIEVCPIQLPGREDRHRERPFTSIVGLSRALAREMRPWLDRPYALFGHSMGALLAFELSRALRQAGAPPPAALFVAAYQAPHVPLARAPIHHLPDPAFIEEMRRLEGTPDAVLANEELMAFMLPTLRADFEACDTYVYTPDAPLDMPVIVYGGQDDREVHGSALDAWRAVTTGPVTVRLWPGTHFFVQSQRAVLLADIATHLAALPV